ncbi:TULIP family P47-like protein [Desulfosporosinus sp. BG]|uniref:TULIP family P47-like protein n=1 Tax=Desulfosporosinus sp. BG TaxID=1633135 RepID=UPI00114C944A|nr:TULIP family P47-like protein [Desulfosporosinus sp. BG]
MLHSNMITHQIIVLNNVTVDDPDHPGQTITKQYLDYADAPGKETEITTYCETAAWIYITEALAGLIAAVVGIVVGELIDKVVARVIIGIIVALVVAVVAAIQVIIDKVIAEGAAEAMPPVDPLIYAATHPIQWPTQTSDFTLTDAHINGVFVLTGDPHFADQLEQLAVTHSKAS